jgi:hypothetical protein
LILYLLPLVSLRDARPVAPGGPRFDLIDTHHGRILLRVIEITGGPTKQEGRMNRSRDIEAEMLRR